MLIKSWGSRGGIPVSGKEFNKYGGDTTCIEIRTRSGDIIIIDAGTGIRRLGNQLVKDGVKRFSMIFTHSHWDHIMGFPFFKPIYMKDFEIRMQKCPIPKYVEKMLGKVMMPPNFPVRYKDIQANIIYEKNCKEEFEIGSVTILPIALSHPNTGFGFKFVEDGKSFVFLTDNELGAVHSGGLPFDAYVDFCEDADLLIHDAEYTPKEYKAAFKWGHSDYNHALDLAIEAGAAKLGLFHLNQDRTDRQMDAIVRKCQKKIEEKGSSLVCVAVGSDMTFEL